MQLTGPWTYPFVYLCHSAPPPPRFLHSISIKKKHFHPSDPLPKPSSSPTGHRINSSEKAKGRGGSGDGRADPAGPVWMPEQALLPADGRRQPLPARRQAPRGARILQPAPRYRPILIRCSPPSNCFDSLRSNNLALRLGRDEQ